MVFKINLSEKNGKTWKTQAEATGIIDKKIGEIIEGKLISEELDGFEFEITGASDKSGFASMKEVEGIGVKRVLLKYGKCMKQKPKKEGKKKLSNPTPKGLKLRKSVRGNTISEDIRQINLKVTKEGKTPLEKIYGSKEEETSETQ